MNTAQNITPMKLTLMISDNMNPKAPRTIECILGASNTVSLYKVRLSMITQDLLEAKLMELLMIRGLKD